MNKYEEWWYRLKRKLWYNTVFSIILEISTIISGLILPRLIIGAFGSNTNGLINSISQFLHIISFLEMGMGSVVQSSLYKPLAEKNNKKISEIIASAGKFFTKIGLTLLCYVSILLVLYPIFVNDNYGWIYTATLIAAMSISFFAQYFFGIVDGILLTADQKGYILYISQTATILLNTLACVIMINIGGTIHLVKLSTSLIYLLRPLILRIYIKKHYAINRRIKYSGEPIKQKWNGVAQHVAHVVLTSTDIVVLTLFSTLANVSIYSVYHYVVYGVKQLFVSMTNGIKAYIGELWAKQDIDKLNKVFSWTEWSVHTAVTLVFSCTGMLILPFITIYTKGVTDANYYQPLFAAFIVLAHASHCLRLPYNMLILASGQYKETQSNHIIAVIINLAVSVACVKMWGLIGVAIGTVISMMYQTVWMANYDSKNIICWPFKNFLKQFIVDVLTAVVIYWTTKWIGLSRISYVDWILISIRTVLIASVDVLIINAVFYKEKITFLLKRIVNMV